MSWSRLKPALLYVAMFPAAGAIFWLVQTQGEALRAPAPPGVLPLAGRAASSAKFDVLPHLLLGLLAVLLASRLVGWAFERLRQPPVMGEVIAGIILGPSVLGLLWPDAEAVIFPRELSPYLEAIAQIGIVLYMFLIGLELNPALLRGRARATVAVSHASIVVPFLLGICTALYMYPRYSSSDVLFLPFALFGGVALSVTAFPVLARILSDRQLQTSHLGALALACAAAGDVTAWCMLAIVVGVAHAAVQRAILTLVLAVLYVVFMLFVCRPFLHRFVARFERAQKITRAVLAGSFVALLVSSLLTELIGIHALFGAFLVGAIIPPDSKLAREIASRLEDLVTVLLLPAFFAVTGLRTQIGLVSDGAAWLTVGLLILVASLGKFGGAYTAARLAGLTRADAGALGVMMNTRGLMELIVLNVGVDLQILSPTLFSMYVLMALVTTLMTTPIVDALASRASLLHGPGARSSPGAEQLIHATADSPSVHD
jgi:Kef-type K+ transport system membrane component KefB